MQNLYESDLNLLSLEKSSLLWDYYAFSPIFYFCIMFLFCSKTLIHPLPPQKITEIGAHVFGGIQTNIWRMEIFFPSESTWENQNTNQKPLLGHHDNVGNLEAFQIWVTQPYPLSHNSTSLFVRKHSHRPHRHGGVGFLQRTHLLLPFTDFN